MRIAVGQSAFLTDEYLAFARQVGARGVQLNTPELPGEGRWHVAELSELSNRVAAAGLTLEAIENFPNSYIDKVILGLPGRDEQIDNINHSIQALADARIPVLGINWMPQSVWRTTLGPLARGGATASAYDDSIAADPARKDEVWVARRDQQADSKDSWVRGSYVPLGVETISEAEMWDAMDYFFAGVRPILERTGIVLAVHPDDPPVEQLHGIPHILRSVDSLMKLVTMGGSPNIKVDLCLGTVSEMGGEEAVLRAIAELGGADKIAYIHMRDVLGTIPRFEEVFLGQGNYSPMKVIRALKAVKFSGFILDDHTPGMINDDSYGYRGRAHALGYIQALIDAVEVTG